MTAWFVWLALAGTPLARGNEFGEHGRCVAGLGRVDFTPEDYSAAVEVVWTVTLTGGFARDVLARAAEDIDLASVAFVATGYALPGLATRWWQFEPPVTSLHWSIFRTFAREQRAMHAGLRRRRRSVERAALVGRLLGNLSSLRAWLEDDEDPVLRRPFVSLELHAGRKGRAHLRPLARGLLAPDVRAETLRVFDRLGEPRIAALVTEFLVDEFDAVVDNHFEILGRSPTRPTARKITERLSGWRRRAVPRAEWPARAQSSAEIARFLVHPRRLSNLPPSPVELSGMDVEFELRRVLAFVTAIQSQIAGLDREPAADVLAEAVERGDADPNSLGRFLERHREAGFARAELIGHARLDLRAIEAWLSRESAAVVDFGRDLARRPNATASDRRSLQIVHGLLPRVRDLVTRALAGLDSRIAYEDDLRETLGEMELALNEILRTRARAGHP